VKKLLITFLILILSLNNYAISEKEYLRVRDSLQQLADNSYGKEQVDALYLLAWHILAYEPEKSDPLISEQLKLADSISYLPGIASAYLNRGFYYYYENDYPKALEYFLKAKLLFKKEHNVNKTGLVDLGVGALYFFSGQMDQSLDYFQLMAKQFEEADNLQYLVISYLLTGYYYNRSDINPELSKQYHDKALKTAREIRIDTIYYAGILTSKSVAYWNTGEYDSCLYFIRRSDAILSGKNIDEINLQLINYWDFSNTFYLMKEYDSALYYSRLSIQGGHKISYNYIISLGNIMMAKVFVQQNNISRALTYYDRALQNALFINRTGNFYSDPAQKYAPAWLLDNWPGFFKVFSKYSRKVWAKRLLTSIYYQMAALYKKTGQPEKALEYFEQYHYYHDSLEQIKYTNELVNKTLNFEMKESEKQIKLLAQENKLKELKNRQNRILLISLLLFLVLIIITGIVLIRQNKLKSDQQNLLLKQRLFRSQMNPHFIFNSLASIQSTIISNEPAKASKYLARFSKLMRNILDSSAEEFIPVEEEISTIENYLALQKIRFPERFDYHIEIDKELDTEEVLIPPMLIQPFVENSIEHGMINKKGNIRVRFKKNDDTIILEVEDDGIGREKARERAAKDYKSLATDIIRERIRILNKKRTRKISFEITDLKDTGGNPTGTRVRLTISV